MSEVEAYWPNEHQSFASETVDEQQPCTITDQVRNYMNSVSDDMPQVNTEKERREWRRTLAELASYDLDENQVQRFHALQMSQYDEADVTRLAVHQHQLAFLAHVDNLRQPLQSWYEQATCKTVSDPRIFFPHPGPGTRIADTQEAIKATALCDRCEVREECATYGAEVISQPSGYYATSIYGGVVLGVRERRSQKIVQKVTNQSF